MEFAEGKQSSVRQNFTARGKYTN